MVTAVRAWRDAAAGIAVAACVMAGMGARVDAQPLPPATPAGDPIIKSAACPAEQAGCTPPALVREEIVAGRSISLCFPDYRIYSSAIVTGVLPIAVGTAMSIKRRGEAAKVYCFMGDMTSESGMAYECVKYSRNHKLPIHFIVEDNEKNRKLVRDILTFRGYPLLESETAQEGIRLAKEKKPALILMDFHLPGMNGIEAFKVLPADPDTSAIPIIAVTASAMTEDRKRIIDAGFDGLQTKPINVKEFLETVAATLKKQSGAA